VPVQGCKLPFFLT